MDNNINPEKVSKWWKVIKTIVELIIAAITGAATATVAQSCGLLDALASL